MSAAAELAVVEAELQQRQDALAVAKQDIMKLKRKRDELAEDPRLGEQRRINTAYWMAVWGDAPQWDDFVSRYTVAETNHVVAMFKAAGFRKADALLAAKHYMLAKDELAIVFAFARDHGMHVHRIDNGLPVAFERIEYTDIAEPVRTNLCDKIPGLIFQHGMSNDRVTTHVWLRKFAAPHPCSHTMRPWLTKLRRSIKNKK